MNTSTVDGTTASPRAARSGVVTSVGWVAKLVPNCSPPKRTARPQAPRRADTVANPDRGQPRRHVVGKGRVKTRRAPPLHCLTRNHRIRDYAQPAEEAEFKQRATFVKAGDLLSRKVVIEECAGRDRRGPERSVGKSSNRGQEGVGGQGHIHTLSGAIETHVRAHRRIDAEVGRPVDDDGCQLGRLQSQVVEVLGAHEQRAARIASHEEGRS
jgi:hypothetical protein